jgi:hypothetical protein
VESPPNFPQSLYIRTALHTGVVVSSKGGGSSMKVRVYIRSDPRYSHLFTNIDKVKDGTSSDGMEGRGKLVLLRKTGKKEDLVNGFRQKVGDQDEMETVAVFNIWTFWCQINDGKQKEEDEAKKQQEKNDEEKHKPDKQRY